MITRSASPRPRCRGWIEPGGLLLALSALACIGPARAQALNWMTPRRLNGQQGHAMAYDLARQRVVLFGGADRSGRSGWDHTAGNFAGTWEWDGSNWAQRAPVTSPPGRRFHAMAYDIARQRVVMFGGEDLTRTITPGSTIPFVLSDTWEWDGNDWTQQTTSTSPSARLGHAMAYDSARQRVVLFGGWRDIPGSFQSDTWEWDGSNWTQRTPAASPSASYGHAMAYDAARQRVVLYGGALLSDTWEWDGSIWTQRSPAPRPQWRSGHAMAYDISRQRVVLFGGSYGVPNPLADTWEWDGSNWTLRTPATTPPGRAYVAMVYDVARQRIVMFEGSGTWEWDGSDWSRRAATTSPRPRTTAMAYDAARQRIVLFGGRDPGWNNQSDTWEWDGSNWSQRSPATSPGARWGHAMAGDIARARVVLFGGAFNVPNAVPTPMSDTWEWDGSNWSQRSPATSPSARWNYAMAYDLARARVVLFGGLVVFPNFLADTWEWDGSNWAQQSPATSPSARAGHAMAYDLARQRIVLYGGWGSNSSWPSDTCEWDGSNWALRTPATTPPLRMGHAMAYDLARQRIVVFGGYHPYGTYNLSDTWEWDGSNKWTQVTPSVSPPEHYLHAMAYDLARQRVVLFGGAAGGASDDTWLFGPDTPAVAQPFGNGCAGSSGPPVLTSSAPYLGNPAFALDLFSARAASPCAFGLAAATQSLPIGPCTLLLQDPMLLHLTVTDAGGLATTPAIALPLDSTLRGLTLFAQAAVVDPQATTGLAFTAGLRFVLGD